MGEGPVAVPYLEAFQDAVEHPAVRWTQGYHPTLTQINNSLIIGFYSYPIRV